MMFAADVVMLLACCLLVVCSVWPLGPTRCCMYACCNDNLIYCIFSNSKTNDKAVQQAENKAKNLFIDLIYQRYIPVFSF